MTNKKFNHDIAEKGLIELLELKIHNLGLYIETHRENGIIETAVEEYRMVNEVAKSIGMDTQAYEDRFWDKRDELKRFGIEIN